MPESSEEPDDEEIANPFEFGTAIATKWDVEIILKPGGERNVPATPEVCNTGSGVWIVEVLDEIEAEHFAKANRHVAVAGEIIVDLKGVGEKWEDDSEWCQSDSGWIVEDSVGDNGDVIGDEDFFQETYDETSEASAEFFKRKLALMKSLFDISIADDWAGDELWEECDVGAEIKDILLNFNFFTIDIDDIGKNLESIETNTNRKFDKWDFEIQTRYSIKVIDGEV